MGSSELGVGGGVEASCDEEHSELVVGGQPSQATTSRVNVRIKGPRLPPVGFRAAGCDRAYPGGLARSCLGATSDLSGVRVQ